MPIRIILVDDHPLWRQTLRDWLAPASDLQVVGEAADGHAALRLAQELAPDVVLMDVVLPGLNGLDATRRLVARHPASTVLALSLHTDAWLVTGMLEAGAAGYVLKGGGAPEVLWAIRLVAAGGTYLSPVLRGMVGPPGDAP
jgi:two-component system NarL family response regulator